MRNSIFAKAVISKMQNAISIDGQSFDGSTATKAMSVVAQGITDYLIANTTVTILYTGIIPGTPPLPDPVVTDTFKIVGNCLPPLPSNNFDSWFVQLQTNIIAGFSLATIGDTGIVFPTKPFLTPVVTVTQANLKSAFDIHDEDPQQKIWEIICDGLIKWLTGPAINHVPGVATHPILGSSGTASIASITIG